MTRKMTLLVTIIVAIAIVFAYIATSNRGATPTDAYKLLYAAVKSKNTEAIKKQLTQKSVEFGEMAAQRNNTPIDKVYENGFTATTFSETLPAMRDQRMSDDMGALEVWNSKESKWEDLPFIKEDGAWKLAVGDMFAGTFKSPGPGRDLLEKQAANTAISSSVPVSPSSNSNTPIPIANMNPPAVRKAPK